MKIRIAIRNILKHKSKNEIGESNRDCTSKRRGFQILRVKSQSQIINLPLTLADSPLTVQTESNPDSYRSLDWICFGILIITFVTEIQFRRFKMI